jgi:hypothetical protein
VVFYYFYLQPAHKQHQTMRMSESAKYQIDQLQNEIYHAEVSLDNIKRQRALRKTICPIIYKDVQDICNSADRENIVEKLIMYFRVEPKSVRGTATEGRLCADGSSYRATWVEEVLDFEKQYLISLENIIEEKEAAIQILKINHNVDTYVDANIKLN